MLISKYFICLLTALLLSSSLIAAESKTPAEDFTLKNRKHENIKLSEQRGDVVMINFWASWCGPCRQEMPILESLYQEYKDLGFTIFGINIDEEGDKAQKFLKGVDVNFPILFDPKSSISELYKVDAMPSTVMIDRDGNKRFFHRGYKPGFEQHYEDEIKKLVME